MPAFATKSGSSRTWWRCRSAARVQRFVVGAAPSYLAAHGRPEHPRDLLEHACILHRFPSGASASWEFERNGEVVRVSPTGPLVAMTLELELGAAISGLGLIASFEELLARHLQAAP